MPMVIPTFQRRVGEQDTPNVRVQNTATPDQYGASIGKGLQQIGNVMQVQQEQDDRNAVIGAKANSDMQLSDYLYNTNTGVMNRKGKDALGLSNQFNKDYDDLIAKNSEGLNERQKAIYNQYALSQKDNYLKSIASHETQQRQIYTETNAKTAISNAQNIAIMNPSDQNLYNSAVDTITKTRKSVYGNLGDDVVNKMVAEDISGIRSEQAAGMLSQGNGIAARDFLIAHKSEIDPKKYDNLYAGAESRAMVQESKAVADDVLNRYGIKDQRAGMKYLKDTYGDNQGYEKFKSVVESRYTDETVLRNREEAQYKKDLAKQIDSAGSMVDANNLIDGSDLPLQTKNELKSAIKTKFKALADPGATKEQKFYASYEARGLYKDQELMDEYEKRVANGEDIPIKQQTRYNDASIRINNYTRFSSGGAYNPSQGNSKEDLKQHESDMWTAIEQLAEKNVPQADIVQKIKQIAPKYGFDPNYFINGTEWDKIGKVKGQYGG